VDGLAARDNALIPLIWIRTLLPGLVCAIAVFVPFRRSARAPVPAGPASGTPVGAIAE
jgi:hypothetical protein